MPLVYVDGQLVAEAEARISAFDHGFVVGDAVFETILLANAQPFALRRHLERLVRSASGLGLPPPEPEIVRKAIESVVATAEFPTGRIRVTYSAGLGPLGSGRLEGPPTLVVACAPCGDEEPTGAVAVVPWTRNERGATVGLKTTSYAENVRALAYAAERDASEAVFANNAGNLCEGTGSNIFVVVDGILLTPPLASGCLAGVTRALVCELSGAKEEDLPISDFGPEVASEAFLTSTLRGVQPIRSVDGRAFAEVPGPRSSAIAADFARLVAATPDP